TVHTGSHRPCLTLIIRGPIARPRVASLCFSLHRTLCTSHARTLHQLSPTANVRWYHPAPTQHNPPAESPSRPASLTAFNILSGQVRARQSADRTSAGCAPCLFLCPRPPAPFPGPHTCTPHPHVVRTPALLVNSPRPLPLPPPLPLR
ncbi:hypothetical protein B0H17DRAFT_1045258, partial [Mycena rosella]